MEGTSCCGLPAADFVLRFQSFLTAPSALFTMAYEVWPVCGDGLDLSVVNRSKGQPESACGLR